MENWSIIITFTYSHEAHVVKGKLESEGIDVIIKDELTARINNYFSTAIGGVKLLVKNSDYERAYQILIESGSIKEQIQKPNKFLNRVDSLTSKLPFIGQSMIELRLLVLIGLALIIIITPLALQSLPSDLEKLTSNSWCVQKINYKGHVLVPYTLGLRMESAYDNCSESMSFTEDGIVDLPGFNSYGERARWKTRNDSLIIEVWPIENNSAMISALELSEKNDTIKKSIFFRAYSFSIHNGKIELKSDSLTIVGRVLSSNF